MRVIPNMVSLASHRMVATSKYAKREWRYRRHSWPTQRDYERWCGVRGHDVLRYGELDYEACFHAYSEPVEIWDDEEDLYTAGTGIDD